MENPEKKTENGGIIVRFFNKIINSVLEFLHLSKYKEQIMYLVVGGGTTAIDWIVFTLLVFLLPDLSHLPFFDRFPNAIEYTAAWTAAVLFAYWASKHFVFESAKKEGTVQFFKFIASRVLTLILSLVGDFFLTGMLKMNEFESITDTKLLFKSLTILLLVIAGFMVAEHFHISNGTVAMLGAAVLMLIYTLGDTHDKRDHKVEEAFNLVDWTTIFFFAGLFAIVYGLEESGVLAVMGHKFVEMTDGSIEKATMLVVWISAIVSTAIDNIPFVATMIPMIKTMEASMGGREAMMPVWWALSLGACYGGNGSLIAASANVIVAGLAQREGHPISFIGFLIWSIPTMLISVAIGALYLHIRFFM